MNTKHRLYGLLPCLILLLCSLFFTGQAAAYDSSDLTIPSCAKAITYGTSGEGRALMAYQFGSGKNVMVLGYEIHGYEDNFDKDGGALVYAAGQIMNQLASNQALLDDYDVVMWTKHGALAIGTDLIEAFDQIDVLSKSAKIYESARSMGFVPTGMSDAEMQELKEVFGL